MQGERGKDNNINWELEEGILLEVEWMKELMCLFTLNKGVSEPWPLQFCIFSE
jgi:hypothetical protein